MCSAVDIAFDAVAFRGCLGQFPTGVCILTASVSGTLVGMTISSFNSVSLDPPLVLFSIGERAKGLELWNRANGYCINVLSDSQSGLSTLFSRPGAKKWQGQCYTIGKFGAPVLPGCAATIECSAFQRQTAGDHSLFIARVEAFSSHPSRKPLVFCKGGYSALQNPHSPGPDGWPLDIHY